MHEGQVDVPAEAVAAAVAEQLPHLAGPEVRRVDSAGTVVAPYRIGAGLLARVPLVPVTGEAEAARLEAERRHAASLREVLDGVVTVPQLVGIGGPFCGYGGTWSVWTWVEGHSLDRLLADPTRVDGVAWDRDTLVDDLAALLRAQQAVAPVEPGWSGIGRGGQPLQDTDWVRRSIVRCGHLLDSAAATRVWEAALAAPDHDAEPSSINGDPMPGNLLLTDGRLSGVVDVGPPVVGDPAADLQPAWVVLDEPQRTAFRRAMGLDDAAWERGRGWAFEMAIGGLHYYEHTNPVFFRLARRTLERLLATG